MLGEQPLALEVVERGEQAMGGEVAGAADDDDVLVPGSAEPGLALIIRPSTPSPGTGVNGRCA